MGEFEIMFIIFALVACIAGAGGANAAGIIGGILMFCVIIGIPLLLKMKK